MDDLLLPEENSKENFKISDKSSEKGSNKVEYTDPSIGRCSQSSNQIVLSIPYENADKSKCNGKYFSFNDNKIKNNIKEDLTIKSSGDHCKDKGKDYNSTKTNSIEIDVNDESKFEDDFKMYENKENYEKEERKCYGINSKKLNKKKFKVFDVIIIKNENSIENKNENKVDEKKKDI